MKTNSIKEVMTKNVVCVTPDQYLIDVKHIYEKDNFHHHIPVAENGKLVGMVSLIDFMYNISGAGISDNNVVYKEKKVKDIMTQNPFFLTTSASVNDVSKALAEGNYHAVPVLENETIVGIVSTADIIKYFLKNTM
ncbi:CBS domain-containing protein [Pontimicrobium aquaticum]|uniref:CBS domain-containing protein n=1 Tax=Pontimicrobium aquaticum TaxID=2565367 RepID=A0A4U0EPC1_9FLAO|nr:CBS domain-containing protein [Pontimicrobium aquaticum]TJY33483.1 CBS domain-containing protein [Pontimicrobium aquaticum]